MGKTSVIMDKKYHNEIEKWSKSFWIETLVKDLHKHGFTVQSEMEKNAMHFMSQINDVSQRNGIILSQIGTLAKAALKCEQRLNSRLKDLAEFYSQDEAN